MVENKKPFYKRGCFVFIMIIIVMVIAVCFIGNNKEDKEDEEVLFEESENKYDETLETEEAETQDEEFVPDETNNTSETVNGIRPEFKEMLDSYEAFYDEYIEFMKRYKSSGNAINMLDEYTDYAARYADTMNKMSELNGSEMSAEEAAYCAEVTARINQKLLEVGMTL